ncbi:glycyl-radical enzyme activating protein [Celerinatantimonas sp. YJH-8]|uniref:glycyl-radical enzyme activating protein n=1 Tax=Celerinatantimonas sp. YJH-8 TaxID=3228714 RepID=UPI0038C27DC3
MTVDDDIRYETRGVIFNIQRYSLHDGPGIRSIPFFKGCPLACQWCCNPESQHPYPEIEYNAMKCLHCGRCVSACPKQAIDLNNPVHVDRSLCNQCGECAKVCPTNALEMKGREVSVAEVIAELAKDSVQYRRSNGGITLSGGEALMQSDFACELLKACQSKGWHTAIETTGCGASRTTIQKVFRYVDLALVDVKMINSDLHQEFTGRDNRKLLENIRLIASLTETIVRVPVIPGVNDNATALSEIIDFTRTLAGVKAIHLLPYHSYGENKYQLLGLDYRLADRNTLPETLMTELKSQVEAAGFSCEVGG